MVLHCVNAPAPMRSRGPEEDLCDGSGGRSRVSARASGIVVGRQHGSADVEAKTEEVSDDRSRSVVVDPGAHTLDHAIVELRLRLDQLAHGLDVNGS